MNVVAHGLWGAAIGLQSKNLSLKQMIFWSIFPDLVWGVPLIIYLLASRAAIPTDFSQAPRWFYHLYGLGHSLVVAIIVISVIWWLRGRFSREMLSWPALHILPDIPGHIHFLTPVLYPLSKMSFSGLFSWTWEPYRTLSFLLPIVIVGIKWYRLVAKRGYVET